jgi:hypothetical protein
VPHKYGTGSRPGSPRGQPAWGGSSDRVVVDYQSPLQKTRLCVSQRDPVATAPGSVFVRCTLGAILR